MASSPCVLAANWYVLSSSFSSFVPWFFTASVRLWWQGPFHCPLGYPIWLSQSAEARHLTAQYQVLYQGRPVAWRNMVSPALRVLPILIHGRSELPPPTVDDSDQQMEVLNHSQMPVSSENGRGAAYEITIRPYIAGEGGHDDTLRLRLLLLHPTQSVVLAVTDSVRFAVMTRALANDTRRPSMVANWGFPPAEVDVAAVAAIRSSKQRRSHASLAMAGRPVQVRHHVILPSGDVLPMWQTVLQPLPLSLAYLPCSLPVDLPGSMPTKRLLSALPAPKAEPASHSAGPSPVPSAPKPAVQPFFQLPTFMAGHLGGAPVPTGPEAAAVPAPAAQAAAGKDSKGEAKHQPRAAPTARSDAAAAARQSMPAPGGLGLMMPPPEAPRSIDPSNRMLPSAAAAAASATSGAPSTTPPSGLNRHFSRSRSRSRSPYRGTGMSPMRSPPASRIELPFSPHGPPTLPSLHTPMMGSMGGNHFFDRSMPFGAMLPLPSHMQPPQMPMSMHERAHAAMLLTPVVVDGGWGSFRGMQPPSP